MKPVYLILAKLILAKLIIKQITTQTSNSGRRKGSQIPGLIIALVWVVICLMISFANMR